MIQRLDARVREGDRQLTGLIRAPCHHPEGMTTAAADATAPTGPLRLSLNSHAMRP